MRHIKNRFPISELVSRVQYDTSTYGRNANAVKLLNSELHDRGAISKQELHQRLRSMTRSKHQAGKRA